MLNGERARVRRTPRLASPSPLLTRNAALEQLTRHQVQGCLARGDLSPLRPGLYAVPGLWSELAPHERHQLLAEATGRADDRAALSHVSAALVWGLPNPRGALPRVELTVTDGPRVSRAASRAHLHRAELPHRHLREVDGLLVTSPARTVVDCFRSLRLGDAVAIGDAALRRGLTSLLEVEDVLDVQRRWPFLGKAWHGIPLLDPRRENWLESYSAAALFLVDIPLATPQVSVFTSDGRFVARVDALWEEEGIIGEADGVGKYLGDFDEHGDRSSQAVARRVVESGARESRLRDLGFEVVRWDPGEITRSPGAMADRWLAARARQDPRRIRARLRYDGAPGLTWYTPSR